MARPKRAPQPRPSSRRDSSRTPADDEESDDPLALTPLRASDSVHRRQVESNNASSRLAMDRVVGGVEMPEGDLVPPSDEEEFDAWAAALLRPRPVPSGPARFSLFSDEGSADTESEHERSMSSSSSDLTPPPSLSYRPPKPPSASRQFTPSVIALSDLDRSPKRRCLNPAASAQSVRSDPASLQQSSDDQQKSPVAAFQPEPVLQPPVQPSQSVENEPATMHSSPPGDVPQSANSLVASQPDLQPAKSPVAAQPDPILQQYQSARTFRTRTALQLQPYTRERQVYEAVLRKGGMKRVKVALPREASSEEFSPETSPKHRTFRVVEIQDEDRTEYFARHERQTDDSDAELQKIARERLRVEKDQRRTRREEKRLQLDDPPSPLHFTNMPHSPAFSPARIPSPSRIPSPHDSTSTRDSSPDSPAPAHTHHLDRIAGRMLPAVMLKADSTKAPIKRRKKAVHSVAAPGRAIRRQGAGEADISSMFEKESSDEPLVPSSDSGSQAEEEKTLARLYQGDFETIVRGRGRTYGKRKPKQRRKRRAVIRLNERAIFSTTEFDLADEPQHRRIDSGVGKAKSWANLAKFSSHFDISPLPSGLECSGFPMPRVAKLVDTIESNTMDTVDCAEHMGVEFDIGLSPAALSEAVDRYFANLHGKMPAAAVVTFLSAMLLADVDFAQLVETHLEALELHIAKVIANGVTDVLSTLWYVLELRLVAAARWGSSEREEAVERTASNMFQLLLLAGFDHALNPLKICLRGESINGKMTDSLTSHWIAVTCIIDAYGREVSNPDLLVKILIHAHDTAYHLDPIGPVASERIWYTIFGLCAISQFNDRGRTTSGYQPVPRWGLVRKALGMIKIAHEDETEDRYVYQGRDQYVRVMIARCVRLSATWNWGFDRGTFPIITRDLGTTFKQRQYRNFPTEAPVDYPDWVIEFDIEQTSLPEAKHETAFEMYLRLVCVAASDMVATTDQIQLADKDIQRLIMSIIPISPVGFNRLSPPTSRQLAQLINRYATMVAACHFTPSILRWLLANSRKWSAFELADFDSRQITIRGLMYVAVACQRHEHSLQAIIERLSEIMRLLQREQDASENKLEARRTMVLVISCFKQIILRHSYIEEKQQMAVYPDPILLDPSWTLRIFELSAHDFQSGLEVVGAVQAYLDIRANALPPSAKRAREERLESQDFGSFSLELDSVTVAQLGGEIVQSPDSKLATILEETICPRIYRLLSDILNGGVQDDHKAMLVQRLAVCWADCAAILVIDHRRLEWTTFIGPFGSQSWLRLGDDAGQVGLHFMLGVLQLDAGAFASHSEEFISLFFSIIGTDRITVEHKFVKALFALPHPLFDGIDVDMDQEQLFEARQGILKTIWQKPSSPTQFANLSCIGA